MIGQRFLLCVLVALTALSATMVDAQRLRGRALQATASADSFKTAMLAAVNAERAKQGLGKLCYNKKLTTAAQLHSEDQARVDKMTHTGSSGSTVGQRVTAQQFKWNGVAENVAAGQKDVASVMSSWMNSDGHRKNIMGDYKFFGMGYAYTASGTYHAYWTQDFASGSTEACDSEAQNESDVIPTPAPSNPEPAPAPAPATPEPTAAPTPEPTAAPTPAPTAAPTPAPTTEAPKPAPTPKRTKMCHSD